ncbi:AAA family ATPase [Patescibacteria group bacterium]|nr:AAA family ATPase [Patescibacteria group bacterium]
MPEDQPKFIVLEGISGSGKTAVGKLLSQQISAEYYHTPPEMFEKMREEAQRTLDLESRFLFYLASTMQASREISSILETQNVVCDKYIWTTICYHKVYGLDVQLPKPDTYRQPDYAFLIVCQEDKRLLRLQARGTYNYGIPIEKRQWSERQCLEEFRKHKLHEIDNTSDNPQNAVNQILATVRK